MSRISPIILLVIVILAIGFFLLGLLQLLVRCLIKRPFSSISQSNGIHDVGGSHTFQRQLQQLFRLHDSGLDQAVIDSLPVFYYKDIIGLKEPFDCAVCLCELSDGDKLKFLPKCTHAFHIHCIETWLLSNSSCPLCRSLIGSGNPMENPLFSFDDSLEQWNLSNHDRANESSSSHLQGMETTWKDNAGPTRIFSIRLGKFRSANPGLESEGKTQNEVTSSSIDGRRCYSMGAFQYVVGDDANLQVALSSCNGGGKKTKGPYTREQLSNNTEADGKKINTRSRGDSLSVSKIWLWSTKEKFASSSEANESVVPSLPNRSSLV